METKKILKSLIFIILILFSFCTYETEFLEKLPEKINITFLHTTDIHSRLFPYHMVVSKFESELGLKQENAPFGGIARIAFLIKKEKKKSQRVLYVDSGDIFQGAPIFNYFYGESEIRALSLIGVDAMVIGNHEFDLGLENLVNHISRWATFPVLVANYIFEDFHTTIPHPLEYFTEPYIIFNLKGIKVGVIGMANLSSMTGIYESGNRLGITPLETCEVAQHYINLLKPQTNLIVILSHLGKDEDEMMIKCTTGIDIVLGGHHHIVFNKIIKDCQTGEIKKQTKCSPGDVILVHSGAFAKFVARLDVIIGKKQSETEDFEILSHKYTLFPVDSTVPEDSLVAELLEPYKDKLSQLINLDLIIGYAPETVKRFGSTGGDSALGNIVAEAIWRRKGIETDFSLTNSAGIRTDIYKGPLTIDEMFEIFPFENKITTMYLSGKEVIELFDFVSRRTAERACKAQAQVAGVKVKLMCNFCEAEKRPKGWPAPQKKEKGCAISIKFGAKKVIKGKNLEWEGGTEVNPDGVYELATNNYIADGGSGYLVLKKNTTKQYTDISMRDAVIDFIKSGKPCSPPLDECIQCETVLKKENLEGYLHCGNVKQNCILEDCLNEVSKRLLYECEKLKDSYEKSKCKKKKKAYAFYQCAETSCIDEGIGAVEDGRIEVIVK